MKSKDIIFMIVALILAAFFIEILWRFTAYLIKMLFLLLIAYVIYQFLKKL
jgi:hypothetical protein